MFIIKSLLGQLVYIANWRLRIKARLHYDRKREQTVQISSERIWTHISFDLTTTWSDSTEGELMVFMDFCSRSAYRLRLYVVHFYVPSLRPRP